MYVKANAVELARKELARTPEERRHGTFLLSSVTDPYQGAERKYRLTRGILAELAGIGYPGMVRILTKSPDRHEGHRPAHQAASDRSRYDRHHD